MSEVDSGLFQLHLDLATLKERNAILVRVVEELRQALAMAEWVLREQAYEEWRNEMEPQRVRQEN